MRAGGMTEATHNDPSNVHWSVRMNHRNRSLAFVVAFAGLALHVGSSEASGLPDGPLTWVALVLQFLVYPQLLYLRARGSERQLETEVGHMMLDSFVFGLWAGLFSFPLWITFMFVVGGFMNPVAFRGLDGLARGLGALAVGAVVGAGSVGFTLQPETSLPVTLLCLGAVTLFLFSFSLGVHRRSVALHHARIRLRRSEAQLHARVEEVTALEAQLRELSVRDPLTGLYNRRYLDPTLERELARCRRAHLPLALMIVDVDHFKRVNDTFGHAGGDAVLRALGACLESTVRASDVACRFGGEEFVLVFPEMPEPVAVARAEQLRVNWAARTVESDGAEIRSTMSVGLAMFPEHGDHAEALLRAADLALYEAKRAGRDRVVVASATPT